MSYTRPPDIPPTVTEETGPMPGQRKTHPAYGTLRFSRVQGDCGKLFGSEINHMGYIEMTLQQAEEVRGLSHSWYHGHGRALCSVKMSAAQFAEIITSMNIGSGVPVTIDYLDDAVGQRPGIADDSTLHDTIKRKIKAKTEKVVDSASDLEKQLGAMLADSKLPKTKQEALRALAATITRELGANMPFVLDQYQESAEKVAAKAKAELDAYTTSVIHRLGEKALAALNEQPPALELHE
jgi:hypothetical protein